jgi:hypothetical protein
MAEWVRCLSAPEGELYAERQGDEAREHLIARRMVEVSYPHLLAAFEEQLLSDEALTAVVEARGESPLPYQLDVQRESIEAAIASIDINGGTD